VHANTNIVALMTTSYLRDELYDELFFACLNLLSHTVMFKVMSLLSIDIEVVVFFAQQSSSWCNKCINAVVHFEST